jgi:hypothetical protein
VTDPPEPSPASRRISRRRSLAPLDDAGYVRGGDGVRANPAGQPLKLLFSWNVAAWTR